MSIETTGAAPELRCPRCGSRQPSMHPAVGGGGEVTALCANDFHEPKPRKPPATPELDRQKKARDEGHSQELGELLEWLGEKGYVICKVDGDGELYPAYVGTQSLLAAFFKIDLDKIEQERRALLEYVRSL